MLRQLAGRVLGGLWSAGGTTAKVAGGAAAVGAVGLAGQGIYAAQTGERSLVSRILGFGGEEVAAGGARAAAEGQFMGFYAFMERLGDFIMSISGGEYGLGLKNWGLRQQGLGEVNADGTPTVEGATPSVVTEGMSETLAAAQLGPEIDDSWGNVINAGAMGVTAGVVSFPGHLIDIADTGLGWAAGLIGGEAGREWWGDQDRDVSTTFGNAAQNGYAWTVDRMGIGAPDLRGAWSSVANDVGYGLGTAAIPGYGLARLGITLGGALSRLGQAFGLVAPGSPRMTSQAARSLDEIQPLENLPVRGPTMALNLNS